jgi:hypothetical protein
MSDYLDAMGAYLADGGFGLYQPGSGVPTIFVLRSFDDPLVGDATIALIPRGGLVDDTFSETHARPNVTVVVRGAVGDATGPHDVAWAVYQYMNPVANAVIHGVPFIRWQCMRTPDFLQEDGQRRTEYTIEFEVWLG